MSEPSTTPQEPKPIAEQYELGDVASLNMPEAAASASEPVAESAVASDPSPAPSPQPRNPNGTFAKPTHQHSSRVVRMATDFGMSEDEIAASPPEVLDEVVLRLHQQQQKLFREHSISTSMERGRESQPKASGDVQPESREASAETSDLGFDTTDYDPHLIATLKKLTQDNADLRKRLDAVQGGLQASARASVTEQCDRAFAKHDAFLGKGGWNEIGQDSAEMIRRKAVLKLVDDMPQKGTLEARIDKAVATLFGSATNTRPPTAAVTEEAWRQGGTARPTHRKSSEPAGTKKAEKAVAEKLAEMNGIEREPESADEFL